MARKREPLRSEIHKAAWAYKEEIRLRLLGEGKNRADALALAAAAMQAKYPNAFKAGSLGGEQLRAVGLLEEPVVQEEAAAPPVEPSLETILPVADVPGSEAGGQDFVRDVEWVYGHYAEVVTIRESGRVVCDFSEHPYPSAGARGLMEWAAENRTAFFKDVAPKYLTKQDVVKEARVQRDRASAEKITAVLERYRKIAEEKAREELG